MPSDLKLDLATGQRSKTKANLLFGSARATLYLVPVTSPLWLSVNGGGSYIRRSGAAYQGASDKDDIGGVVGAAVGFRLGSRLSFYVAADDYIYGTRIDETTLTADKQTRTTCTSRSASEYRSAAADLSQHARARTPIHELGRGSVRY
ncbi:MAG: hypothetical protein H0W67_00420 [Gemmatimonadales bacterium]|nr:hypothetical protein [Gemmatimonadales bacterium]